MSIKDKTHGHPALPGSINPPPAGEAAGQPDVSRTYFFLFWGVIALTAAAAWLLAIILPGTSESIIERWLMAALAAALAVLLLIYRP